LRRPSLNRSLAIRILFILVALSVTLVSAPMAAQQSDAALRDFDQRVNQYLSVKGKQNVSSKQSASSNQIADQKQQTLDKLRQARANAKQGDIFSPTVADYFKQQIHATVSSPQGARVIASLRRAEPTPDLQLHVNEKYPPHLPLQSTPPTLLQNLPRLPKGLQYRVVGTSLVLYDVDSDLIVDYIPDAIPGAPVKKK
jgi:hypothetical protein